MAFTYSKIAEYEVPSGGVSVIDFKNIPQNYTDLILKLSLRTSNSATSDTVLLNFNGVSTSQSGRRLNGDGSAVSSSTLTSFSFIVDGNTATANTFGNTEIYIPNYAGSNNKSFSLDGVRENNSATADAIYDQFIAALWSNTTAINTIQIAGQGTSFQQYSTATLYGIRATEY